MVNYKISFCFISETVLGQANNKDHILDPYKIVSWIPRLILWSPPACRWSKFPQSYFENFSTSILQIYLILCFLLSCSLCNPHDISSRVLQRTTGCHPDSWHWKNSQYQSHQIWDITITTTPTQIMSPYSILLYSVFQFNNHISEFLKTERLTAPLTGEHRST